MSPAAAPHAKHIMALPAPLDVVQRAPVEQVLFAQQIPPGEPHSAQMPAASQTAPGSQLLPAQHGAPGPPHAGPLPPVPVVPAPPEVPAVADVPAVPDVPAPPEV